MERRNNLVAANCDPVARKKIKELEKAVGGGVRISLVFTDDGEEVITNVTYADLQRMLENEELPNGVYSEYFRSASGDKTDLRVERIVIVKPTESNEHDDAISVIVGTGNEVIFPRNGEPFVP